MVSIALIATVAFAAAPFSQVTLDNITDRPILGRTTLFGAVGEEMMRHAANLSPGQVGDEQAWITAKGFTLTFEVDLEPGNYLFEAIARGNSPGDDSYWLSVDGEQVAAPMRFPVGEFGPGRLPVAIQEAGRHTLTLSLREAAGSALKSVHLVQTTVQSPLPPMRTELMQARPRLLITPDSLPELRRRMDSEAGKAYYKLPGAIGRDAPAFRPNARNGGPFRSLGNYALAELLQPDEQRLAGILSWLDVATTYPNVGADLDAEYFMEGVALAYDWLYDNIPEELRARVRETIIRHCRLIFDASMAGIQGGGQSYQQNHYWYAHLALALGAAAVYGETPEADQWLPWAWERFERIPLTFSPDGGFHEGPSYWDFSMPALYLYTDLYEWCTGLRIPAGDDGLRGQAQFRFHHLYPGLMQSVALEDSTIPLGRSNPSLFLWEARRFRDPLNMGMAALINAGASGDKFRLLWLDDSMPTTDALRELPTGRYYPDIETAFMRTSWDPNATHAAFVSRPMGGHKWAEISGPRNLSGVGHNHPEQNHFTLFGRGQVLAMDPGYTYSKQTRNHNTVLVNGLGQYGDGEMWPRPNPGRAHVTGFINQGDVSVVAGDATTAYPPEVGLTRFDREFVLAGRDLVVVHDRLAAQEPSVFSWLLHHYGEIQPVAKPSGWQVNNAGATLTVLPLAPAQFEGATETYRPQYVHPTRDLTPDAADIGLLELKSPRLRETTFLVPLIIGTAEESAPMVTNRSAEGVDAVQVGGTLVAFNRENAETALQLPWGEELKTSARVIVAREVDGERQIISLPWPAAQ